MSEVLRNAASLITWTTGPGKRPRLALLASPDVKLDSTPFGPLQRTKKSSTHRDELLSLSIGRPIPIPLIRKLKLVVMTPRWRRIFFSFLLTATAVAGLAAIRSSRATNQ